MQTRARRQQQQFLPTAATAAALPHLPLSAQQLILDKVCAAFPLPDQQEYTLYPFRSSCAWLLNLQRVCSTWRDILQRQPVMKRRVRLERLCHLWSLHHYAYYIVSKDKSKQQRIKQVPRSICLQFADGSSTTFDVPKGGAAGAAKQQKRARRGGGQHGGSSSIDVTGLPTHGLLLWCSSQQITPAALVELLRDVDALDSQQAAPILVQVVRASASSGSISQQGQGALSQHQQPGASAAAAAGDDSSPKLPQPHQQAVAGNSKQVFEALDAAASAAISSSGGLVDVVKEGSCASGVLTFIPTKQGFCRRVPLQG